MQESTVDYDLWQRVVTTETSGSISYTPEEMNQMWEAGRVKGRREHEQEINALIQKEFLANMKLSAELGHQLLSELAKQGFTGYAIFLDTDFISQYQMAAIVSEDAFVSDEFDAIYDFVNDAIQGVRSATYDPGFTFVPVDSMQSLNIKALHGDGFTFRLNNRV